MLLWLCVIDSSYKVIHRMNTKTLIKSPPSPADFYPLAIPAFTLSNPIARRSIYGCSGDGSREAFMACAKLSSNTYNKKLKKLRKTSKQGGKPQVRSRNCREGRHVCCAPLMKMVSDLPSWRSWWKRKEVKKNYTIKNTIREFSVRWWVQRITDN